MRDTGWIAPRRGGPLLLVLLAHGLLLGLLGAALQRAPRFAMPRLAAPTVSLIWLSEAPKTPPSTAADPPRPRHAPSPPLRLTEREVAQPATAGQAATQFTRPPNEPQAITLPAPGPAPADAIPPATNSTSASTAPLDLRLPSQRASQPLPAAALTRDDPRVRERLSYGERMARGIGADNTLHEEALPDGSRRFQQGTGCVIARPARISELDAFNNSATPKPRSIGPC